MAEERPLAATTLIRAHARPRTRGLCLIRTSQRPQPARQRACQPEARQTRGTCEPRWCHPPGGPACPRERAPPGRAAFGFWCLVAGRCLPILMTLIHTHRPRPPVRRSARHSVRLAVNRAEALSGAAPGPFPGRGGALGFRKRLRRPFTPCSVQGRPCPGPRLSLRYPSKSSTRVPGVPGVRLDAEAERRRSRRFFRFSLPRTPELHDPGTLQGSLPSTKNAKRTAIFIF